MRFLKGYGRSGDKFFFKKDRATYIYDNGAVLTFVDGTTGSKTLAQLAASNIVAKGAGDMPYTLVVSDYCILATTAGDGETLTLPNAINETIYVIKLVTHGGGNLTIATNDEGTIDGNATIALNASGESVILACDGTNWHILSVYKFA